MIVSQVVPSIMADSTQIAQQRRWPPLIDLVYDWPQGFSRYYLSARNIRRRFPVASVRKLEAVLGCRLRVIRRHI